MWHQLHLIPASPTPLAGHDTALPRSRRPVTSLRTASPLTRSPPGTTSSTRHRSGRPPSHAHSHPPLRRHQRDWRPAGGARPPPPRAAAAAVRCRRRAQSAAADDRRSRRRRRRRSMRKSVVRLPAPAGRRCPGFRVQGREETAWAQNITTAAVPGGWDFRL